MVWQSFVVFIFKWAGEIISELEHFQGREGDLLKIFLFVWRVKDKSWQSDVLLSQHQILVGQTCFAKTMSNSVDRAEQMCASDFTAPGDYPIFPYL